MKSEPDVQVDVVDGNRGELTVSVDDQVVSQKGDDMPTAQDVLTSIRKADAGAAR